MVSSHLTMRTTVEAHRGKDGAGGCKASRGRDHPGARLEPVQIAATGQPDAEKATIRSTCDGRWDRSLVETLEARCLNQVASSQVDCGSR
jgi:hypothetical protein